MNYGMTARKQPVRRSGRTPSEMGEWTMRYRSLYDHGVPAEDHLMAYDEEDALGIFHRMGIQQCSDCEVWSEVAARKNDDSLCIACTLTRAHELLDDESVWWAFGVRSHVRLRAVFGVDTRASRGH